MDAHKIRDRMPSADPQVLRKEFRMKLESASSLLKEKYFTGGGLNR